MRAVLAVLAAVLAGSSAAILHLEVGASCKPAGGIQRVCKRLEHCPEAQAGIKKRQFPEICSIIGLELVVCCPNLAPTTSTTNAAPTSLSKGVGEVCKEAGRERWYCRQHKDCPETDRIQKGLSPDICHFQDGEPVICCPPSQGSQHTETTEEPVVWVQQKNPTHLSKSEEKCKIYGRFVYKNVTPPILLPGVQTYEEAFCGRVITPLILKGEDAKPREFPHMARIGYGEKPMIHWLCGGSLISERYILSAAHCTRLSDGRVASWANLGDLDTSRTDDDAQPITLKIIERIDHPDYQPSGALYHDISLYKLERNVPLGIYIRPICLNTKSVLKETVAVASGWGHTMWRDPGGGSAKLQKVDIKFVSASTCNDSYKSNIPKQLPQGINPRYMLCAGGHDGKDTCQGDSGGPLQIARREPYCTYSIVGVTSFGKGCGTQTPGVYTNVANYVPWIERIVWPE